ncbi:MAG: hypothetical protein R3F59_04515 [Myxococcota bacterium]
MLLPWVPIAAAALPPPVAPDAGPVVAVQAARGASPDGPWAEAAVGLGADVRRALAVRAWVPAALTADERGVRIGPGRPARRRCGRRGGTASPRWRGWRVGPWGRRDVVQRGWGVTAWGGLRTALGPAAAWLQGGATWAPSLRPIALPSPPRGASALAHRPFQAPAAAPVAAGTLALADPQPWLAGLARASVGYDHGHGLAAATLTAAVGGGVDLAVGLAVASAPDRPLQGALEVTVPVVTARQDGALLAATLAWRP